MEEFIKNQSEKLLQLKKNIFTQKHSFEFIQKLCERGDVANMESQLTKCLMKSNKSTEERQAFISTFLEEYNKLINEGTSSTSNSKSVAQIPDLKEFKQQAKDFTWGEKFKVKNKDKEFPTLDNLELVTRKKNFEVLDRHYAHKLEKGIKICFCMSTKHPLVGNCLSCGRIQCLQEGDKECIVCGSEIIKRDEYLKGIANDVDAKKAHMHKEKLLKFQSDFYSKLQIVDDFSDWYEISNNTWLSKDNRQLAKKKDEDMDRVRDNPEFEYNVNFKTLEITKVYETVDEDKMIKELTNLALNDIKKAREANTTITCSNITEKALIDFSNLTKLNRESGKSLNFEVNVKNLSSRIELDSNEKIGGEFLDYNKHFLSTVEMMNENDNFLEDTDLGMCLSMHQPWASLLVEGFKRFEGREWTSDYRGILWIHATSQKPTRELIAEVEGEYSALYKNAKMCPQFPKRYPTSCLLGCVDVVDVVDRGTYMKIIPEVFREKSESKYLFFCKNPQKLEIPIKMPGQPNIYKLDDDVIERAKGHLRKISTFWWPCPNLNANLIEIPFSCLLRPNETAVKSKNQKQQNLNKIKITNNQSLFDSTDNPFKSFPFNYLVHVQNFISQERKENILSFIEAFKKEMTFYSNYLSPPYLSYGISKEYSKGPTMPIIFTDIFKDIAVFFRDEKKIKLNLKLENVIVEYVDWYGMHNFRENEYKSVKIFVGNPTIVSLLSDYSDARGMSMRLDCGDVFYISDKVIYAVSQVLYDIQTRVLKMKQGVVCITFNCI